MQADLLKRTFEGSPAFRISPLHLTTSAKQVDSASIGGCFVATELLLRLSLTEVLEKRGRQFRTVYAASVAA